MGGLRDYRRKRDFTKTEEPAGTTGRRSRVSVRGGAYCIHKHAASRLHYDLRLELDGVLKSWAVPKGPSRDPSVKRLAVEVEDHPLEYGDFEGTIPKAQYGGGTVMLWDAGTWEPVGDASDGLKKGELKFRLDGQRLQGGWVLVRTGGPQRDDERQWLLIKERDDDARPGEPDPWSDEDRSVKGGRTMQEIAAGKLPRATAAETRSGPGRARSAAHRRASRAPATVGASLATLVDRPPREDGDWVHEIKYDGYRILARVDDGDVRLVTRNGQDWTAYFPAVAAELARLPVAAAWLDGEVVVFDRHGVSDFGALQRVLKEGRREEATYIAFDLLYEDGEDLRERPLLERKRRLQRLLGRRRGGERAVRYGDHIEGAGDDVLDEACRRQLEGVVSKRAEGRYAGRRTRSWLKAKCGRRQEFVVGGFTDPGGSRRGFGALLVGVREADASLRYAGRVGAGFDDTTLERLATRLRTMERHTPPFADPPSGAQARGVHWTSPRLVVEVAFAEWTGDGRLRQPVFKGLREDKPPSAVVREGGSAGTQTVLGVVITHPDRPVFADAGLTKLDVAEYYAEVAERMLPHLEGRPLTVIRCPDGVVAGCFYQKHVTPSVPRGVSRVRVRGTGGKEDVTYPVVDSAKTLIAMVQNGAVEFHVWGSRTGAIESPDLVVFDLDPGPDVEWRRVREAAKALREQLARHDLESFVKTSGGKGLHVVVPFAARSRWPAVASFTREVAEALVDLAPERYTATMSKAKRQGKVFIDHFRNGRGATSAAPYSLRARPGAPVALPVSWGELGRTAGGGAWTAERVLRRLRSGQADPWAAFAEAGRQPLRRGRS
jgi:bifunctional non-homologous end joining protein LigD